MFRSLYVECTCTSNSSNLCLQHGLTLKEALHEAKDVHERGTLFQQLMDLTDKVLESYSSQLDTIKQYSGNNTANQHFEEVRQQYELHRTELIMPFCEFYTNNTVISCNFKYVSVRPIKIMSLSLNLFS